jgi:uncharacterized Zn finger protein
MPKCPRCYSENIVDEDLTYPANQQNTPKPIFKCKDCGEIFRIDENIKKAKNHNMPTNLDF